MVGHATHTGPNPRKNTPSRPRLRLPPVDENSVHELTPLPGRTIAPVGISKGPLRRPVHPDAGPAFQHKLSQKLRSLCQLNRSKVRKALNNAVYLDVDLRQLAMISRDVTTDGIKELREEDLCHLVDTEYADGQCRSFFDSNGYLIGFHFPGYLTEQESRDHSNYMKDFAAVYPPKLSADTQGRGAAEGYKQQNGNVTGCHHISPGWDEIGHANLPPQPSSTFCASTTKKKAAAVERLLSWLSPFQFRLDHLLQMTAPDPHAAYFKSMECLRKGVETAKHAKNWDSSFQGISIIYNRATPSHQDDKGCLAGLDALLSVGPYHHCLLILKILGLELSYDPGTLVLILGSIIPHEVGDWGVEGERTCLVHFTHKALLKHFGIAQPRFTHIDDIRAACAR
ncbi:hypothetical protein FA95DRAFT_1514650 [Auriscalpium vulgare]|uniref:Uncharacterized protein n=1 Tax=Auriscalpium vulgare TaxID=40419 RepID=A0ACB8S2T5_9AGAM|nr:hypothetical protein FA95DRAFT_1514650 [Auriscalpium vulgare]